MRRSLKQKYKIGSRCGYDPRSVSGFNARELSWSGYSSASGSWSGYREGYWVGYWSWSMSGKVSAARSNLDVA